MTGKARDKDELPYDPHRPAQDHPLSQAARASSAAAEQTLREGKDASEMINALPDDIHPDAKTEVGPKD